MKGFKEVLTRPSKDENVVEMFDANKYLVWLTIYGVLLLGISFLLLFIFLPLGLLLMTFWLFLLANSIDYFIGLNMLGEVWAEPEVSNELYTRYMIYRFKNQTRILSYLKSIGSSTLNQEVYDILNTLYFCELDSKEYEMYPLFDINKEFNDMLNDKLIESTSIVARCDKWVNSKTKYLFSKRSVRRLAINIRTFDKYFNVRQKEEYVENLMRMQEVMEDN